jgi:hypothetical protein
MWGYFFGYAAHGHIILISNEEKGGKRDKPGMTYPIIGWENASCQEKAEIIIRNPIYVPVT